MDHRELACPRSDRAHPRGRSGRIRRRWDGAPGNLRFGLGGGSVSLASRRRTCFKEREAGIEEPVASVPLFSPKAPWRIRGRGMTGSASIQGSCSPDPTRFLESAGSSGGSPPQNSGQRPGQPVDVGPGPGMSRSPTGYHESYGQRVLLPPPGFQPSPPVPRRFPADRSRWQDRPPPVRQGHGRCSGPWLEGRARGGVEGRVDPQCSGPRTRP
jgi:hypothetical protein